MTYHATRLLYLVLTFAMTCGHLLAAEQRRIESGKTYTLTAKCSLKVLAVQGGGITDGALVHQWTYDGGPAQLWRVDLVGAGEYKITSQVSGKSLEVAGSSPVDATTVQQWTDVGGANQRWQIVDAGGGWYKLVAKHSGKCLDVNGSGTGNGVKVQQYQDNGGNAQRWRFDVVTSPTIPAPELSPGTYRLLAKHSNLALDVAASSMADGGNVQQYTDNGTNAQRWILEDAGNGYSKLKAKHSGKYLDVAAASTANGANVQQLASSGGDNQKWQIVHNTGSYFRLMAKHSLKYLDVSGVSTASGANVHQWQATTGANQIWKLTPCYDLTMGTTPITITVGADDYVKVQSQVTGTVTAYELCGTTTIAPFATTSGTTFVVPTVTPGFFTYRTRNSAGTEIATLEITVVKVDLSDLSIADEYGFSRPVTVTVKPAGADVTFCSSNPSLLTVGVPTYANDKATFQITAKAAGAASIVATIPGPSGVTAIARRRIDGFTLQTSATSYIPVINTFSDGSRLGEAFLTMSPLRANLQIKMTAFSGGLTFEDSTTALSFPTSSFLPSGTAGNRVYRLIRLDGYTGNWCHNFTAFDGSIQISRTH